MIFENVDSTIFAFATPVVPSGRAILRISGTKTFAIAEQLFDFDRKIRINECKSSRAESGYLVLGEGLKVRGYCWIFKSPGTYTGEDMSEFHIIGSPVLERLVEQRCIELGAQRAQAGEFTARAFLNGRIDLSQVRAIRLLTEARNDAQIESAIEMLEGKYHALLAEEYERISELVSRVEANIDFSEEEIEVIGLNELMSRIDELSERLEGMLASSVDKKRIEYLPRVFVVGVANAGKSTLVNCLSGLERAICSPLAGTTRDVISTVLKRGNREIMLCDTAGLMSEGTNVIDEKALLHTKNMLKLADMFIIVFDACEDIDKQVQLIRRWGVNERKAFIAINKIDLLSQERLREAEIRLRDIYEEQRILSVSARDGTNLNELAKRIFSALENLSVTVAKGQIALDIRTRELLYQAVCGLKEAKKNAEMLSMRSDLAELGLEIVAESLSYALRNLGALLGKDITEDVLENIFSEFCIGK